MRFNPLTAQFELEAGTGSASVDGTAINPSSIGATTRGVGKFTEVWVHAEDTVALLKADSGDTWRMLIGSHIALSANSDNFGIGGVLGIGSEGHAPQVFLTYDAANTLAQRNGTNAQESRLYATYTSSTNYERLSSKYDSGSSAFVIGTEKGASGGSARDLIIQRDGTKILTFDANGVSISTVGHCSNNGGLFDVGFGAMNAGYPGIRFGSSAFLFSDHLLQYGGQTSSFPALKRSGTTLQARLADDTGFAPISVLTVKTNPVTYADLPAAATIGDGAHAFITDSNLSYNSLNIGSAVSGGGANSTPVVTIGGAWVVG